MVRKSDRRSEERHPIRMRIEFLTETEECEKLNEGPRETFTTDISFSGLGLFSDCPIEKGQTIKIFLRHVSDKPIVAEVRWYRKLAENLYKIGVQYLNPPSSGVIVARN